MGISGDDGPAARVRREAAEWMARLQGPERETWRLPFERWRAANPRHRAAYAEMEQIARLTRRLGSRRPGYAARLPLQPPTWRRPAVRRALAGLAAVLLAGTLSTFLFFRHGARPGQAVASVAKVGTPIGHIRQTVLADGTKITLDAASTIEVEFTASERLIRLVRGRARFDVARDANRRFLVVANGRTITDRGTVFDVELGRNGIDVTLLRGAVDVHGGTGGKAVRLVPGDVYKDEPGSAEPSLARAAAGGERWTDGMLSFDGAPLGDVVDRVNRYAPHPIRLGDPELAALRVTGSFPASAGDRIADMLAGAFDLRLERGPQGERTLRRR